MDARQRRRTRRKWFKKHEEELKRIIDWINSPDIFVSMSACEGEEILMGPERICAFGEKYPDTRRGWKEFLFKKGVPVSELAAGIEYIPLLAHTSI